MPDLTLIPSVEALTELKGKTVLLRADFNVPSAGGALRDTFRIDSTLPTLRLLLARSARVILVSHRTDGGSLAPVAEYLNTLLPVAFAKDKESIPSSSTVLLENLRLSPLEEANDEAFAKELASLADYYVNEAFSVSHREHASIVGVPRYIPGFAGLRFLEEVRELSTAFSPEHPFLFILGGAKVETKEPIIKKFLKGADTLFVGGVLANDFLTAKGYPVGRSLLSEVPADAELVHHPRVLLPEDLIVTGGEAGKRVSTLADVGSDERIVDVGPETVLMLKERIREARLVLWNGPLGLYEEGYSEGSLELGEALASASARTILGGGDTLSALPKAVKERISFVSTGGGAMLQFLSEGTLPGITALTPQE